MGLPIWREPAADEPATKTDPTAQARSTIRRHIRRAIAPSLHRSSTQRLREDDDTGSLRPRSHTYYSQNFEVAPEPPISDVRPTASARPRSRRGPSRDLDNMPPLRRMGDRQIADERNRSGTQNRPAAASTRVNGLGDRERSWSPDGEADAWAVMGNTIEPDANLPSASTSFASGAERSFGTRAEERSGNIPQSRLITSFFGQDQETNDNNEESLRALGELERHEREARVRMNAIIGESELLIGDNEIPHTTQDDTYWRGRVSPPQRLTTPPALRELEERVSRRQRLTTPPELRELAARSSYRPQYVRGRLQTPPEVRDLAARSGYRPQNAPMRAPTPPANPAIDLECPVVDQTSNTEEVSVEERTFQQLSDEFFGEVNELLNRRTPTTLGATSDVIHEMLCVLRSDRDHEENREETRSRRRREGRA